MIDFVVMHWYVLLLGGLIAALGDLARNRRKAVDRLRDAIGEAWSKDD